MSEDVPRLTADEDIVALAREEIEKSREALRRSADEESEEITKDVQQPGVTIDLGHRGIQNLPEEVIDIIKDEIERLALSHNSLGDLPPRLSECSRLRYLNVRYNALKDIPRSVLKLSSLEILDVSKNKLTSLPDEFANLTSLKVLAIQKNKIKRLPLALGNITSLAVIKLDGNPIEFPPPDICSISKDLDPPPDNENLKDSIITNQVKRFLRGQTMRDQLKVDSEGESSEGTVETPRPPKRTMSSGRFPVKPSISSMDAFNETAAESPKGAPPIPTKSHYRGLSAQNAARRPAIQPLVMSSNERNRSQSEGATAATIRAKRMGMISSKSASKDEGRANKRLSHLRGAYSAGSALSNRTDVNGVVTSRPPPSRPLSDLMEHKRASRAPDSVVNAAKGIYYAIFQLHEPMMRLLDTSKQDPQEQLPDVPNRMYAVAAQIRQLNGFLEQFDTLAEEDEEDAIRLSASIRKSCGTLIGCFKALAASLAENARFVLQNCDARYVRTLLVMFQASHMEIRNSCSMLGVGFKDQVKNVRYIQSSSQPLSSVPRRMASLKYSNGSNGVNMPNGVQYGLPALPSSASTSRTNTMTSMSGMSAITPRSGESFPASINGSRSNTMLTNGEADDERNFERIYVRLRNACELILNGLPRYQERFTASRDAALRDPGLGNSKVEAWGRTVDRADEALQTAVALKSTLSTIRLRDAYARNRQDFWQLCTAFSKCWTDFALSIKEMGSYGLIPDDIKYALKPMHKAVKDTSSAIHNSQWSHLATRNVNQPLAVVTNSMPPPPLPPMPATAVSTSFPSHIPGPINTSFSSSNSYFPSAISSASSYTPSNSYAPSNASTPLATPLSAALGAAAQATVPNTPAGNPPGQTPVSATSDASVGRRPDFFERADTFLALQNTQRRV